MMTPEAFATFLASVSDASAAYAEAMTEVCLGVSRGEMDAILNEHPEAVGAMRHAAKLMVEMAAAVSVAARQIEARAGELAALAAAAAATPTTGLN